MSYRYNCQLLLSKNLIKSVFYKHQLKIQAAAEKVNGWLNTFEGSAPQ